MAVFSCIACNFEVELDKPDGIREGIAGLLLGVVVDEVMVVVVVVTILRVSKNKGEGELKFADGKGISSARALSMVRSALVCSSSS